jgi:hypothetical protein
MQYVSKLYRSNVHLQTDIVYASITEDPHTSGVF